MDSYPRSESPVRSLEISKWTPIGWAEWVIILVFGGSPLVTLPVSKGDEFCQFLAENVREFPDPQPAFDIGAQI